jgi:hypothetical protein
VLFAAKRNCCIHKNGNYVLKLELERQAQQQTRKKLQFLLSLSLARFGFVQFLSQYIAEAISALVTCNEAGRRRRKISLFFLFISLKSLCAHTPAIDRKKYSPLPARLLFLFFLLRNISFIIFLIKSFKAFLYTVILACPHACYYLSKITAAAAEEEEEELVAFAS